MVMIPGAREYKLILKILGKLIHTFFACAFSFHLAKEHGQLSCSLRKSGVFQEYCS